MCRCRAPSWLTYSPEPGASVAARRVTLYCIGVSNCVPFGVGLDDLGHSIGFVEAILAQRRFCVALSRNGYLTRAPAPARPASGEAVTGALLQSVRQRNAERQPEDQRRYQRPGDNAARRIERVVPAMQPSVRVDTLCARICECVCHRALRLKGLRQIRRHDASIRCNVPHDRRKPVVAVGHPAPGGCPTRKCGAVPSDTPAGRQYRAS